MGCSGAQNILAQAPLPHYIAGDNARGHAHGQCAQHDHRIDRGIGGEKTADHIHRDAHQGTGPRSEEDAGKDDTDILQRKPVIDGHGEQILAQNAHHDGDRREHGKKGDESGFFAGCFVFRHSYTSECLSSLLQSEICSRMQQRDAAYAPRS